MAGLTSGQWRPRWGRCRGDASGSECLERIADHQVHGSARAGVEDDDRAGHLRDDHCRRGLVACSSSNFGGAADRLGQRVVRDVDDRETARPHLRAALDASPLRSVAL